MAGHELAAREMRPRLHERGHEAGRERHTADQQKAARPVVYSAGRPTSPRASCFAAFTTLGRALQRATPATAIGRSAGTRVLAGVGEARQADG